QEIQSGRCDHQRRPQSLNRVIAKKPLARRLFCLRKILIKCFPLWHFVAEHEAPEGFLFFRTSVASMQVASVWSA
ncbi:MAG TPA: hypothetical protein VGK97_07170, partial [Spongiibacteraceae bacterium]